MIPKYRNQAIVRITTGFTALLLALVVMAVIDDRTPYHYLWRILTATLALGGFVVYAFGCVAWAEAKGYSSSVAIGLLIVGLFGLILLAFILPPVVLFVLDDKTHVHRSHSTQSTEARRVKKAFTPRQHYCRAVIGIVIGIVLAIISAVAGYFDYAPGKGTRWSWVILLALPIVGWSCSHLARYRGYSSAFAYGLMLFGLFASGFVFRTPSPLIVGFMFIFVEILPIGVILVLPKKSGHFRRQEP